MDISQYASSVVHASWPCAINQPQHHTLDSKFGVWTEIFSKEYVAYSPYNSAFLNSILMDFEMLQFGLEDFQMSPF